MSSLQIHVAKPLTDCTSWQVILGGLSCKNSLLTILQVSNLIFRSLRLTSSPPVLSDLRLSILNPFSISPFYFNFLGPHLHLRVFFLAILKILLIFQGPSQMISLISVLLSSYMHILSYLMSFLFFISYFKYLLNKKRDSVNQPIALMPFFKILSSSSSLSL